MPAPDPEADLRAVISNEDRRVEHRRVPGRDRCRAREPVRRHPSPAAAGARCARRLPQGPYPGDRDRGQPRRRRRVDRRVAEARSDCGVRRRRRQRRSCGRARPQHPGDQHPRRSGGGGRRPGDRPAARLHAPDPARRSLRAKRRLVQQGADPARPWRRRQDHGGRRARRHRPRHRQARRGVAHADHLSRAAPQAGCAV